MNPAPPPPPTNSGRSGFALIATISILVLLALIAVGLLSLSSVTVRANSAGQATAEARQNARFAMLMALGQLQSLTGQDTRVTANSTLLSESNVMLTGAWRSWEGTDHDGSGKPIAPDYPSKRKAGDPADSPEDAASGRFLGWLASPNASSSPDSGSFTGISSTSTADTVVLVGDGCVTEAKQKVHVKPTLINDSQGAMAWWTSGDNAKAMVNVDREEEPSSMVDWQERVRSNGRPDADYFELEDVDDLLGKGAIPSTASLKLVNFGAELRKMHDLTAFNRGLITNTATGGWRRDLSLLSQHFGSLPSGGLPLFTLKPGEEQEYSKAQSSSHPPAALIYPWSQYRGSPSRPGWAQVPPICSWTALVDYTRQYENLTSSGARKTAMPPVAYGLGSSERYNYQDQVRRVPQLARIHWIYSLSSALATEANGLASRRYPGKHVAALMITPVVTVWNPYNVELSVSNFELHIQETAPLKFTFKVGGTVYPDNTLSDITKKKTGYTRFRLKINQSFTLAPGATRIFGLNDREPKDNSQASNVVLSPGYQPGGGFLFFGINKGSNVYASPGDVFAVEKIGYDAKTKEGGKEGIGIVYNIRVNGGTKAAHRMVYDIGELGGSTVSTALYPPLTNTLSATISEVEGVRNRPFASAIFGYRVVTPPSLDPKHRYLYSKGLLQANPLCYYSEVGYGDNNAAVTSMAGTGVYHPINAPYDFVFQDVDGWNDTLSIPQFEPGSNSSYIVSGLSAGDGLTRCVVAELPTRPLQSLAQLQHFDARNNNPIPPFQFNLIGNSSANPIFAPDQLFVSSDYNNGMCNDDAYFLNHMLFDDWFVSSIDVDTEDFSRRSDRPMAKVYQDHLEGVQPLPNRFYLPSREASRLPVSEAVASVESTGKDPETGQYGFESIASKLEVEGMFNINSVSLDAWKALLRQAHDLEVPYLDPGGGTESGSPSSYSYPRTSIAGDRATDSGSSDSNPLFPQAVEFAGHRALTDTQIDALAEEIVKEIRLRGPFLSLSEFVNRQVTSDKDLALAGTIQKALDNLGKFSSSSRNPFATLQSLALEIDSAPPGDTDYKFPEAALGSTAFGVPGWVRQADILTPLAPMLSARDDTFTIRAYGDSRDKSDPSKVLGQAWCEVVVQRKAAYVDRSDSAAIAPYSDEMASNINKRFGRRYEVASFRWLKADEL